MKVLTQILIFASFYLSSHALATSYSPLSTIKSISVGTEYVRVKLHSMGTMEQNERCEDGQTGAGTFNGNGTEHGNFVLDLSVPNAETLYSTILASKAMKENVFLQLTGCFQGYPKINHIYVCDEMWCP